MVNPRKAWRGPSLGAPERLRNLLDRQIDGLGRLMAQHLCRYLPAPIGWLPRRVRASSLPGASGCEGLACPGQLPLAHPVQGLLNRCGEGVLAPRRRTRPGLLPTVVPTHPARRAPRDAGEQLGQLARNHGNVPGANAGPARTASTPLLGQRHPSADKRFADRAGSGSGTCAPRG